MQFLPLPQEKELSITIEAPMVSQYWWHYCLYLVACIYEGDQNRKDWNFRITFEKEVLGYSWVRRLRNAPVCSWISLLFKILFWQMFRVNDSFRHAGHLIKSDVLVHLLTLFLSFASWLSEKCYLVLLHFVWCYLLFMCAPYLILVSSEWIVL